MAHLVDEEEKDEAGSKSPSVKHGVEKEGDEHRAAHFQHGQAELEQGQEPFAGGGNGDEDGREELLDALPKGLAIHEWSLHRRKDSLFRREGKGGKGGGIEKQNSKGLAREFAD
jgi:hypothetical protein